MSDVLKVSPSARLRLTKNTNTVLYDQLYQPDESTFTLMAGQVVSINAASSRTLDFGAIALGRKTLLQVDRAANLKVNASATVIPLLANGVFFLAASSLASIKVLNPSATYTLSVNYLVTD